MSITSPPSVSPRRPSSRSGRAASSIAAGADGITAHLREDRRHIRDDDMARLKAEISKPLNFEMARPTKMVRYRAEDKPTRCVWCRKSAPSAPPKAGLDAVKQRVQLAPVVQTLKQRASAVAVHRRAACPDRSRGRTRRAGD